MPLTLVKLPLCCIAGSFLWQSDILCKPRGRGQAKLNSKLAWKLRFCRICFDHSTVGEQFWSLEPDIWTAGRNFASEEQTDNQRRLVWTSQNGDKRFDSRTQTYKRRPNRTFTDLWERKIAGQEGQKDTQKEIEGFETGSTVSTKIQTLHNNKKSAKTRLTKAKNHLNDLLENQPPGTGLPRKNAIRRGINKVQSE